MRYGILADIHSNWEALQTVMGLCRNEGVEQYLCVGDIVGYGANPKECLGLIREVKAVCVAGNHDWAVGGRLDADYFNPAARSAVAWTKGKLGSEDLAFLHGLPLVYKNDDLIMVHGTLREPGAFDYLIHASHAEDVFSSMDQSVCLVGHSHVPQIIVKEQRGLRLAHTLSVKVNRTNKYIVNVGSVGQPRDGDPRASYGLYDTRSGVMDVRRAVYDIKAAQRGILLAGLPVSLAQRLAIGH